LASIDIDELETWPSAIAEAATGLQGSLPWDVSDVEREVWFRKLLDGHRIRAYHCTRLLPHEVDRVSREGLQPLSEALLQRRLDEALTSSALTEEQAVALRTATVFHDGRQRGRAGQVNCFLGQWALRRGGHGLNNLLGMWGGEGITMSHGAQPHLLLLRSLGAPCIVSVDLEFEPQSDPFIHPPIWTAFARQLSHPEGENLVAIHWRAAVPRVVDVWQRGEPEYGRFPKLTQT
jgi:hypothetical protein